MRAQIRELPDSQYRLIAGIVAAILETIDERKLRFLKAAALNVAKSSYLETFEAQLLTRILRDISTAEISFLVEYRGRPVSFGHGDHPSAPLNPVFLDKSSAEGAVAIGLINLGLLVRSPDEGTAADIGAYIVSPFVERLLRLLTE